jgi:hypothetical protein
VILRVREDVSSRRLRHGRPHIGPMLERSAGRPKDSRSSGALTEAVLLVVHVARLLGVPLMPTAILPHNPVTERVEEPEPPWSPWVLALAMWRTYSTGGGGG